VKTRLVRVGLAGALLVAVSAPLAQQASAMVCDDLTFAVCLTLGTACNVIDKEKVYDLSCALG